MAAFIQGPDSAVLGGRLFALALVMTKDIIPMLELNQAVYHAGDNFEIHARVPTNRHPVIVEQRADGTYIQFFPNRLQAEDASGSRVINVPAAGQARVEATGPPGPRKVRLVIFPPDQAPSQFDPSNVSGLVVIEKTYSVE